MTLVVRKAMGLCTVQDLGRRGLMHVAVPPGGALVPELLVAANRAVGNPDDAAGIEVLGRLDVRAESNIVISIDGDSRVLHAGEELSVTSGAQRCAYLAMRGGIDAPIVLGGRGTLLCADLGRPLRTDDVLRAATGGHQTSSGPLLEVAPGPIEIIPGPDFDAFDRAVIDVLVRAPYRVMPTSDRVGTRLTGAVLPRVARYRERSRPMVIGAIEVPADGQPIVLGPEHPTTGGYPVVGVIRSAHLGRFALIPLGGIVQFGLEESA